VATPRSDEEIARRAIPLIDLTDLADDHGGDGIDALCERARRFGTAAVCVWPEHVGRCASLLASSGVRVATVVNFPTGDEPLGDVEHATAAALADGADEIDVVLPYHAFADGRVEEAERTLQAVRSQVRPPAVMKVILETGALPAELVGPAAQLAVDNGADFVKTSTGKTGVGATLDAAAAMLEVISRGDRPVGLKPSGGIRTPADAAAYLALADEVMGADWASPATFRFGASGLLGALVAALPDAPGAATGSGGDPAY
jgi:deoxyribose-phosphate aldolase